MAAQDPQMDRFAGCMAAAFAKAVAPELRQTHKLSVAGHTVLLRFAGPALAEAILPALAHLEIDAGTGPDPEITFHLWDTASTGIYPPTLPFGVDDYRRYGHRAIVDDGQTVLMHALGKQILYLYDRKQRAGFFWTQDADRLSIYERAAPLQTLLYWALREFGWQIVHAAAVGTATGGVLLVGNTGAGKSTTALSCLAQDGLRFLSDDKCLARLGPTPQACAVFSSGKIKADMLEHLPQFRDRLRGWDDSYKAGKGLVFLYPDYAQRLVATLAVKALVVPHVAHQTQASIRPVSSSTVFRVFGPSTVIWLPGAEADNYRFTAELVQRVPCYQLDLALDLQRNTDAILDLLGEL
jgi:hypothetical protein